MTSISNCGHCDNSYDPDTRIPIALHCGHSFCKPCINQAAMQIQRNYQVTCWNCRRITITGNFAPNNLAIKLLFPKQPPTENAAASPLPLQQRSSNVQLPRPQLQPPAESAAATAAAALPLPQQQHPSSVQLPRFQLAAKQEQESYDSYLEFIKFLKESRRKP